MLNRISRLGKALTKVQQKEIFAGLVGRCSIFPDDCPPGKCCDVSTRRCVNPPGGCA